MPRPLTLWLWMFTALSWIACAIPLLLLGFFDWCLITPSEVSGTLFGGAMGTQMYLSGWAVATVALALTLVFRLPGSTLAWIGAGIMPLVMGAGWLLFYPDDADGHLMFSPQQHEIGVAMLVGAAFLISGEYLRRRRLKRPVAPPKAGFLLLLRTLVAGLLVSLFTFVPWTIYKELTLPTCAFNKAGQQLSVCIGHDSEEPVIVD